MGNEKDSYGQPVCNWCKDPRQFMPRIGLCRRCNRFRKDAEQAEALAKKYAEAGREPSPYEEGHQIRRALKRVELAKREGFRYGPSSRQDPIMGLTLEHELDFISKGAGVPHIYYGKAGIIERDFTIEEQKAILRLLAPLGGAIFRKHLDRMVEAELLYEDHNPRK